MIQNANNSAVLMAKDLHVSYAGNTVLSVDELSINKGEIVGVVGANGAGKSTLANSLLGWSRGNPSVKGSVFLGGESIDNLATHQRVQRGLLLVPEGKLIFNHKTVAENLTTSFDVKPTPGRNLYTRAEIYSLFPRLEERAGHYGSQLSGGERQMLGIGRALMLGPEVLILDEPSIGLAPQLVSLVLNTLRTLAHDGLPIILVEQNVHAAIEVVDRLILLERGKIVLEGPTEELKNNKRIAEAYLGAQVT